MSSSISSEYKFDMNKSSAPANLTFTFNINLNITTDNGPSLKKPSGLKDDDTVVDIKRLPEVFDPRAYGPQTLPVRSPRAPRDFKGYRGVRKSQSKGSVNASVQTALSPKADDESEWSVRSQALKLPKMNGRSTDSMCEIAAIPMAIGRSPSGSQWYNRRGPSRNSESMAEIAALPVQFEDKTAASPRGGGNSTSSRRRRRSFGSVKPCSSVSTAKSSMSNVSSSSSSSSGTSSSSANTTSSSMQTSGSRGSFGGRRSPMSRN